MSLHINYLGQGKPLVFFHGWGFNHKIWLPLVPLLKSKYQIILVDLPGFGLTPQINWAEFKKKLLEHLPKTFALIGWSLGGLYATELTLAEPSRVTCLLNINSSPRFIEDNLWPGIKENLFDQFYQDFSRQPENTLKDFVQLQAKNPIVDSLLKPLPSLEGLRLGLDILKNWDLREGLKQLTQPVGFMFGQRDRITPAALLNSMQMLYPHFDYILFKQAAHMPFLSHPDLFIKEMEAFIL